MKVHDNTNIFHLTIAVLLQGVNVWSIIGNIIIIIIVAKTRGPKGITGFMLVSLAVADMVSESLSLLTYIDFISDGVNFNRQIILRLGLFAVNGAAAHTLSALSFNLYFAICRPNAFKNFVKWSRVYAMLCMSWLVNVGIVSLYCLEPDVYVMKPTGKILMNVNLKNCWFIALITTNLIIIPFCSVLFCFIRIYSFTRLPSIATVGAKHVRKLKLSQMIHVTTMMFLLTYIPIIVVLSLGVEGQGARSITAIVNYSYHACKLFIYLKCYKPFRQTCKEMCCVNNSVQPNVRPAANNAIFALPAAETNV